MDRFVHVPVERLEPATLQALLEEYASRDGTDYGETETPLAHRVQQLSGQLAQGLLVLVYDAEQSLWDLLDAREARKLTHD